MEDRDKEVKPVKLSGSATMESSHGIGKVKDYINSNVKDVKNHVIEDVLIPGIMNGIQDALVGFINGIFNGRSKGRGTNYGNAYNRMNSSYIGNVSWINNDGFGGKYQQPVVDNNNYTNLRFDNLADADLVIDRLADIIEQRGYASVADLYKILQMPYSREDVNMIWTSLASARPERINGKYRLRMPMPRTN